MESTNQVQKQSTQHQRGYIAVDLDGTLAKYDKWRGIHHIGDPVEPMLLRVKTWLEKGYKVKIFTARVSKGDEAVKPIHEWCKKHLGRVLPVTNVKDFAMIELWDDRCVRVEANTGKVMDIAFQMIGEDADDGDDIN